MITIWKFPILQTNPNPDAGARFYTDRPTLVMPIGAEFLTVQMQDDRPMLWVRVNDQAPTKAFQLVIVGTGQEAPDSLFSTYIGTWQHKGFVFHLFHLLGGDPE